ncbi:MAG TPA: hypothetical protein VIV12_29745 [Streptosporangiaceae bacterium]
MSENGQVATEVAEQAIAEVTEAPAKLWLHPDALKPRDYLRGKTALKAELEERGHQSCYDFLGTDEMYPFLIWALKSREDPSFGWDDALDTEFSEFSMGDERPPPPTLPAEKPGRSDSTPNENGSARRQPRRAAAPSSASGLGSPEPSTTS